MPDPLYYSLWFPTFAPIEMLPKALSAMRQFPFSKTTGVDYLSLHPISWTEATALERRYPAGTLPEEALRDAEESLFDDYAYVFRLHWDLWQPVPESPEWLRTPRAVSLIVNAPHFDDGSCEQNGHLQFDLGLDTPFLHEDVEITDEVSSYVRANIQQLVAFTSSLEKATGANMRLLWSESEENLAQKLLTRLQKTQ